MLIREEIEQREITLLHPLARLALKSAGREAYEEPDPIRTCFMVDRDRIIHSKSFRRLKHKTQVFIAPPGDHYRTRLTHTVYLLVQHNLMPLVFIPMAVIHNLILLAFILIIHSLKFPVFILARQAVVVIRTQVAM